ncbi:unnamed protein product [Haemonchus placei]|uniref:Uncharacterized protein n=1 Tax=Haemonchus placei TaxID=6290 RepID=A0A0N4WB78_HAEPC|nr:unnamed protein product [Haemonchus placei]
MLVRSHGRIDPKPVTTSFWNAPMSSNSIRIRDSWCVSVRYRNLLEPTKTVLLSSQTSLLRINRSQVVEEM